MNRTTAMVLGAATLLALAGCSSTQGDGIASAGGTQGTAQSAEPASDEEKAFEFVECMREHDVDLPDPVPNGEGGFDFGAEEFDVGDPNLGGALQACRDKLPGGGQKYFDDPEVQEQMREFAQCMRDNGVDIPDPEPGEGFGGAFADIDRDSPTFQAAMRACKDKMPDRGDR